MHSALPFQRVTIQWGISLITQLSCEVIVTATATLRSQVRHDLQFHRYVAFLSSSILHVTEYTINVHSFRHYNVTLQLLSFISIFSTSHAQRRNSHSLTPSVYITKDNSKTTLRRSHFEDYMLKITFWRHRITCYIGLYRAIRGCIRPTMQVSSIHDWLQEPGWLFTFMNIMSRAHSNASKLSQQQPHSNTSYSKFPCILHAFSFNLCSCSPVWSTLWNERPWTCIVVPVTCDESDVQCSPFRIPHGKLEMFNFFR
jgi:hypothetical protein